MEFKENMTQEEFEQAIALAKEGLFGEEELSKRVQSETDKVRTQYVQKIKDLEGKLPVEKSEQELALETKERELKQLEKSLTVKSVLQKNNLPENLAKYLDFEDAEEFESELSEIINKQMLQTSYKPETHKTNQGITREEFRNMNYEERVALSESNPTLFQALSVSLYHK